MPWFLPWHAALGIVSSSVLCRYVQDGRHVVQMILDILQIVIPQLLDSYSGVTETGPAAALSSGHRTLSQLHMLDKTVEMTADRLMVSPPYYRNVRCRLSPWPSL